MAAYVLAQLEITDRDAFAAYSAQVKATVDKYGGRFVVRGGAYEVLEAEFRADRVVILAFPDIAAAKRWYGSPEYSPLIPTRQKASKGPIILIEGA